MNFPVPVRVNRDRRLRLIASRRGAPRPDDTLLDGQPVRWMI
ncbi:hypothetical protein [Acetobacter papayae]|nr:hypothetical protein [Acetobacter papayae]